MIFDKLDNLEKYAEIFAQAAAVIRRCSAATPCGRIDIDGDGLFAKVEEYQTKLPEEGLFESHLQYIDVQSCLSGAEGMHFLDISECNAVKSDCNNDYIVHTPKTGCHNYIVVHPGEAVVFFPQDAHRPQMRTYRGPETIKKIVVKIKCPTPN
ncbi:MAG: YhcH/YjgK/YiaL family protein [Deltaproteobacteria bacterium]|nr:YhcH/YjgK/YiaL family protein [Deltaproteobacteria bacterium]